MARDTNIKAYVTVEVHRLVCRNDIRGAVEEFVDGVREEFGHGVTITGLEAVQEVQATDLQPGDTIRFRLGGHDGVEVVVRVDETDDTLWVRGRPDSYDIPLDISKLTELRRIVREDYINRQGA